MWTFTAADRAGVVLLALQAIDPLTLPNALARIVLKGLIDMFMSLPAAVGVIVTVKSDLTQGIIISVQRVAFGSYAT